MNEQTFDRAGFGWALVGAIACAAALPLEPSLLEEGILLHIAQRLAHGEHLYRDVIAFSGPLPFEALAALFRIFGDHLWVGRAAVLVLHAGSTGLVHTLVRRGTTQRRAHLAASVFATTPLLLFPLYSLFYYTTVALYLSVIATYAAERARSSNHWAAAAGVAVACTALSKQSIGAALALGIGGVLVVQLPRERRLRGISAFAAGGLATALLTLAAFAAAGSLSDFLHAMIWLPLQLGDSYTSPYVNLWPLGTFSPEIAHNQRFYLPYFYTLLYPKIAGPGFPSIAFTQLCYALPLAAAVATPLIAVWRGSVSQPISHTAWLHLALLVAWISNLFPRADWGHLSHVLPFALIQFALILPTRGDRRDVASTRKRVTGRLAMAGVWVTIAAAAVAGALLYRLSSPPSFGPRIPLRSTSRASSSQAASRAISFLLQRTEPGEEIFVARAEPLLYFATGTRNPTPFPGIVPGMREEQERIIVPALDSIRYVVMSDVDQPSMTYYRDELPAVQAHLERYFQVPRVFTAGQLQWLTVLERKGDRGATEVDLIERVPLARPFLVDAQGRQVATPPLPQRLATQYNRRPLGFALGARGGGIDFDVDIPANAVFQGGVGLRKTHDHELRYPHPQASILSVSIRRAGAPAEEFEGLAEARAMEGDLLGTRWTEVEADLRSYAGERVTLRLQLASRMPIPEHSLGWWGSPRIAIRPDSVSEASESVRQAQPPDDPESFHRDSK